MELSTVHQSIHPSDSARVKQAITDLHRQARDASNTHQFRYVLFVRSNRSETDAWVSVSTSGRENSGELPAMVAELTAYVESGSTDVPTQEEMKIAAIRAMNDRLTAATDTLANAAASIRNAHTRASVMEVVESMRAPVTPSSRQPDALNAPIMYAETHRGVRIVAP